MSHYKAVYKSTDILLYIVRGEWYDSGASYAERLVYWVYLMMSSQ